MGKRRSGGMFRTEKLMHGLNQLQNAIIINPIINKICIFSINNNTVIPQDGEMLGNIGVGGFDLGLNISNRHFIILQKTKNFQTNGMSHSLQ